MRYSDFKKLATGNTSQVRPGSTSMNFPSPMGPKKEAPMKKLPIAQDEIALNHTDPAALRVTQAQVPLIYQTMPGQQQPKPGVMLHYNKGLHDARQNAANEIQQMRRDTAAGKQVDTSGLTPTQYRYVASGRKGSGYNVEDTDEELQKTIYAPDPEDTEWNTKRRQEVANDLKQRQYNGEIMSQKQLNGWTPEEVKYINSTRQEGLDLNKQLYEDKSYKPQQRDIEAMTPEERKQVFGRSYGIDGMVASDTFKAPLAPGETYVDRAKELMQDMHDRVEKDYHWISGGMSRHNTDAENFDIWRQENPEEFENWFNSLESAFGSSNIDALTELQKMAQPGEDGKPSKLSMLPPEYRARLQKAGETATWNAVKDNPLNINKAIGLWLRQNGHGGMADFVSDSVLFYGSLAALLAGGVVLGGIFGDDDDDDDRYPQQQADMPAGYNKIPYMG